MNTGIRRLFLIPHEGLTPLLTSQDLIKCSAILLMICDHIGAFIFPEDNIYRLIGRCAAPIWLMMAGYARTRDIPPPFWMGIFILCLTGIIAGGPLFPINILGSIVLVRLTIDKMAAVACRSTGNLFRMYISLFVLSLPLYLAFDYGAFVFMFALYGYMIRNRDELPISRMVQYIYGVAVALGYAAFEIYVFQFTHLESMALLILVALTMLLMSGFKVVTLSGLTARLPNWVVGLLQFGGRQSLIIYVVHFAVLEIAGTYLGHNNKEWFEFTLFPWHGSLLDGTAS